MLSGAEHFLQDWTHSHQMPATENGEDTVVPHETVSDRLNCVPVAQHAHLDADPFEVVA
jgi:hypothetical protein